MEDRSSLEKYIKPGSKLIALGIILIIAGGGAMAYEIVNNQFMLGVTLLALCVIVGSILIAAAAVKNNKFKKRMDELEKNGDMQDILYDFANGRRFFKNTLILGQYFIISKRGGDVIEYSDVDKLYQLVKGNGSKAKRVIQIKTKDKKKINLCRIPVNGSEVGQEFGKALGYITAKNRNIQL